MSEITPKSASALAGKTKKAFFRRRSGCPLSMPGAPENEPELDYKNPALLLKFVSKGGRILPSRVTNVCAHKQRKLKKEIKIARILALLPFISNASR